MIVLGIDLGKQGAVAALDREGKLLELHPTPLVVAATRGGKKLGRDDYDVPAMVRTLGEITHGEIAHAFVEKGQALPPKMGGGVANFQRGLSFGLWTGILAGLGIAYEVVPPQTWQKAMLAGIPGDTKIRSAIAAGRLWPGTDFRRTLKCRSAHDGFTDASLLAEFGRRRLGQGK